MELGRDKTVAELIRRLKTAKPGDGAVKVEGTWGSFAPMLVAHISKQLDKPILYICPHIDDADKAADDLHGLGTEDVRLLAAWEDTETPADATDEIRLERMKVVSGCDQGKPVITVPVQAICQPIPKPQMLRTGSLQLTVEKEIPPQQLVGWLVENSFERVERIDLPGQFAQRGGIVDIYAPLVREKNTQQTAAAIRIEFFGDAIESVRSIDLDTQRSSRQIESVGIVPAVWAKKDNELFINILPKDTIIILEEPNDIEETAKVFVERSDTQQLYKWQDIYDAIEGFRQLRICRFAAEGRGEFLKLDIKSVQQFQHSAASLWAGHKQTLAELVALAKKGKKVCLYCETPAEIERVTEIITADNQKLPANFKLLTGFINQGFVIDSLNTIIITHHELFGQFTLRRKLRQARPTVPVDSLADLAEGDYVVHSSYGIGKFAGIKTIKEKNRTAEYLTLEYADGMKIHVPAGNITLVQKYIGTSPKRPKLSKIGSKRWQKQKERVAKSVRDLAAELLDVQARRQQAGGITFGPDSNWQAEFEESFGYQETIDQTTAAEQIKADMQQLMPMDRLLCGDVGYGKTELAMRAAFKAVENGKQVAVLVPTTVLSVQHARTFTERFADFPVCVEVLNRFKTTRQARDIIARTKQAKVDILIGTHRLLSGDVGFKDLGLLVIDEEQRFGVEHKERLKKLRVNVDVLTMTATPIPRTLHMAMLGLRDISSLQTPPLDRRSIVTNVGAYSDEVLRKAVLRELNRQGQVFFVHNRVKTIEKKAWQLQKLLADTGVKITVAHGQMAKSELEKAMIDFVLGKIDVLVCTTIIESGLDIPNANTIFIDNADRFGLAELHQLRGRVGRYKHRAFAYMMLPKSRTITPLAARRLKAIEEYSHLGAGFRIALRDLEIRGAGNILGPEQSGHIQMVGYQMYCELLADAVRKLKDEPAEALPMVNLDLGFDAYIPKNYIPLDRNRMEAYRKIASARTKTDARQLTDEFADVYGPIPEQVELLLELAKLRITADKQGIKAIVASGQDLIFSFTKDAAQTKSLFEKVSGKIKVSDPQTLRLRLAKNYFEPKTIINILRKILDTAG